MNSEKEKIDINLQSTETVESNDEGLKAPCPEYIIRAAEGLKEAFLKQASVEIAEAGRNSYYKDPDTLRRFYFENYFFGPISDSLEETDLYSWIRYSNSIKNGILKELEEQVNHLRGDHFPQL